MKLHLARLVFWASPRAEAAGEATFAVVWAWVLSEKTAPPQMLRQGSAWRALPGPRAALGWLLAKRRSRS